VAAFWTFRRVDLDGDGCVSEQELVDALPALSSFFERPAGHGGRRCGDAER
jgi:Ca2+-binding EF-hand superfamily protein